jgi:hypothetical protein
MLRCDIPDEPRRILVSLNRFVSEGQIIPWGYAVAYRDFDRDTKVCYPIPLHLLVRWVRDFRFWFMRVGRPGYRERLEGEWRRKGAEDEAYVRRLMANLQQPDVDKRV